MKANELRINNYIQFPDGLEYKVHKIYNDHICLKACDPIPITKNWLLRFGFEIFNDNEFACTLKYKNFEYCFPKHNLSNGNFATYKKFSTNLKYIHQLQNLYFALTNEELIIK